MFGCINRMLFSAEPECFPLAHNCDLIPTGSSLRPFLLLLHRPCLQLEWSPYPVFYYFLFLLPTVPQDLCTCCFYCPAHSSCVKSSHPHFLQVTVTEVLFS